MADSAAPPSDRSVVRSRGVADAAPAAPAAPAADVRSASATARMCVGVVPQQPPTRVTPASANRVR